MREATCIKEGSVTVGGLGTVERFLTLERSLCAALRAAKEDQALRAARQIFEQEESSHRHELDVLRLEVMTVAGIVTRECFELDVPVQAGLAVHNEFRVIVMAAESHDELWSGFAEFIRRSIDLVRRHVWDAACRESLAKQYIREHCHRDITLDEMAELTYMTRSHFSRMFKRWTGQTFTAYVQAQRIERAKRLLVEANGLPITRVAELVGYQDPGHFSRVFRSIEGVLPSEYRQSKAV